MYRQTGEPGRHVVQYMLPDTEQVGSMELNKCTSFRLKKKLNDLHS